MLRIKHTWESTDMNLKLIISLIFLNLMFVNMGFSMENPQSAINQLLNISGTELPSLQAQPSITPVALKNIIEPEPVVEESKILVYNGIFSIQPLYGGNVLPPQTVEDELEWLRYEDFHVSLKRKNPKNSVIVSTLTLRISFKYGGTYHGKGAYMADIRVRGLKSESPGTMGLSLVAELPRSSIGNCGTMDNPIASIDLILNLSLRPDFYHNAFQSFKLQLRGNGTLLLPSGEILSPSLTSGSVYYW